MRHSIIYLLLGLLCPLYGIAQCPDGDIILGNQAQVDSFRIKYPNCTEIQSDLIVGIYQVGTSTTSDIKNLDSLLCIEKVAGNLRIVRNDSLASLNGLDSLNEVSNLTFIGYNKLLSNLQGLEGLVMADDLQIQHNLSLKNFQGLENLLSSGRVYIHDNDSLVSFTGLHNIDSIGYLAILDHRRLQNLQGFDNLTKISQLFIAHNNGLVNLNGFDALDTISGQISIYNNSKLINCGVLALCNRLKGNPGITYIYGNAIGCLSPDEILDSCGYLLECPPGITLYSQEKIDDFKKRYPDCSCINGNVLVDQASPFTGLIYNFDSLHNVSVIRGKLDFTNIHNVKDLCGFNNLDSVYGDVDIDRMDELVSLAGFDELDYVGGSLYIGSTRRLKSIEALSNLQHIGSTLYISFNDSLLSLQGLQNIDTIYDDLHVRRNVLLEDCTGLDALKVVGGYLEFWGNDSLRNFQGLGELSKVGINFHVTNNQSLQNFSGLDKLDSVGYIGDAGGGYSEIYDGYIWTAGGILYIEDNKSLLNLMGLEGLSYIRGTLAIGGNDSLQDISGLHALDRIDGFLYIYSNPSLNSLDMFNLQYVGRDLAIKDNETLSECDIELLCNHLLEDAPDFGNTIIENNATGCNGKYEVLVNCSPCPNCILSVDNNWLGGADSNWHTPSNWSTGEVPTECDNVFIKNGSEVHVLGDAVCNTIDVEQGAVLNVQDHLLRVACEN